MNAISALREKIPSIPWSKLGQIPALLRREFLDQKTGFFYVPMVVAGLTLFVLILGLINAEIQMGDDIELDLGNATITIDGEVIGGDDLDGELNGLSRDKFVELLSKAFTGGTSAGLLMILPFVVFFSLLSTLYDDRRDRSFLFWKSMPVSDTKEVLSKFAFCALVGPFILFAFMMLLGLASMVVVTPFIWLHNGSAFELLWGPAPYGMWFSLAANYVVYAFWILPFLAWLLLASSYAPKAPMIFAVVPIIVIIAGEGIFRPENMAIGQIMLDRLALDYAHIMGDIFEEKGLFEGDFEVHMLTMGDAFSALGKSFASFKFWIGQLFTGVFVAAAIYLRRYKV